MALIAAHGERAMPVEGRVAAAHVGCCVLCVVLCAVVVTSPFSYLTGRNKKIGPAKMADESALITKNASLDAPNVKGVWCTPGWGTK